MMMDLTEETNFDTFPPTEVTIMLAITIFATIVGDMLPVTDSTPLIGDFLIGIQCFFFHTCPCMSIYCSPSYKHMTPTLTISDLSEVLIEFQIFTHIFLNQL